MFRKTYWWLYLVYRSIPWMWRYCLGDEVIHQDRKWILTQGVRHPIWSLCRRVQNGENVIIEVHENDFRKVCTPYNIWHSFRTGYRFFRGNWYDIWVMNNHRSGSP